MMSIYQHERDIDVQKLIGGQRSRQRIDKLPDETEDEQIRNNADQAMAAVSGYFSIQLWSDAFLVAPLEVEDTLTREPARRPASRGRPLMWPYSNRLSARANCRT